MSKVQNYQGKWNPKEDYLIECVTSVHIEAERRYEDHTSIICIKKGNEYALWNKHKEVLGFKTIKILHDPTKAKQEDESEKFSVTYLGDRLTLTREEIKDLLDENKVKYFNGAKTEQLVEKVSEITSEE